MGAESSPKQSSEAVRIRNGGDINEVEARIMTVDTQRPELAEDQRKTGLEQEVLSLKQDEIRTERLNEVSRRQSEITRRIEELEKYQSLDAINETAKLVAEFSFLRSEAVRIRNGGDINEVAG